MKKLVYLLIIFFSHYSLSYAQTNSFYEHGYKIEQFKSDQGFKYDEITDIIQARNGYLWMVSFTSLIRYDGYEFRFFKPEKSVRLNNSEDYFYHLMEDVEGNIICSTFGKTLWKFRPNEELFEKIDFEASGYVGGPFRPLVQDSIYKSIWIGLSDELVEWNEIDTPFIKKHLPIDFGLTIKELYDSLELNGQILDSLFAVENNQQEATSFQLKEPARIAVIAQGELLSNQLNPPTVMDDYGWIEQEDGTTIWKMDANKTYTTGSLGKNRIQIAFIDLLSGTYTLHYKSNDYHAYNNWNNKPPSVPNWWGIQVIEITPPQELSILAKLEQLEKENAPTTKAWILPYEDPKGGIWISSYYGGLHKMIQANDTIRFEAICDWVGTTRCPWDALISMAAYDADHLLVSSSDYKNGWQAGLYNTRTNEYKIFNTGTGTQAPFYKSAVDQNKNVWLGKNGYGVFLIKPPFTYSPNAVEPNLINFSIGLQEKDNRNSADMIRALKVDNFNNVWIGTRMSYLYKISAQEEPLQFIDFNSMGYEGKGIFDLLFEDAQGTIWIHDNTSSNFIQYKQSSDTITTLNLEKIVPKPSFSFILKDDRGTSVVKHFTKPVLDQNGMDAIFWKEMEEKLFFGYQLDEHRYFVKGVAAYIYNANTHEVIAPVPNALKNNTGGAQSIFKDKTNQLWIAGRQYLYTYNLQNNKLDTIANDINCYAFLDHEEEDKLWLGTIYGLGLLNKNDGTIEYFDENDGLINSYIVEMIKDKEEMIWIFTFKGISKFNPKTKVFTNYNQLDNIGKLRRGYGIDAMQDEEGRFWVLGENGLFTFHPKNLTMDQKAPVVNIQSLNFEDQGKESKFTSFEKEQMIEFGYLQNDLTLEYVGMNFNNPSLVTYSYLMEGLSEEWQQVNQERTARFLDLPPNNYTFKVKAANADGIWSEATSLSFKVNPPWWKTWWAYLLYTLAIVGSIFWYIRNLNKKLQKEQLHNKELADLNVELTDINTANQRFVPKDFLQILGKQSIKDLHLGDQTQTQMTILFSDIRSYTTMSEKMTPQQNFNFINEYLGRVGPIIKQHGGFISQYMGDGFMALFVKNPATAIQASIAMQKELEEYNRERIAASRKPLKTGIGLNTGDLMLGVIGDEYRYESTVISDAVNTASRMEGLTKVFGGAIILTEKTLVGLLDTEKQSNTEDFAYRCLGKVKVKGKDKALKIFDLYEGESIKSRELKAQTKIIFEKGINHYFSREFGKAAECFKQVLTVHENDLAAQYYLDRSVGYIVDGVAEDWNGVEEMVMK